MNQIPSFSLAAWGFLVSPWMPVLMFIPFLPWAWIISSKLEKDARLFHLNMQMWNSLHIGAGVAALIAMLAIPVFWASWPIGIIILYAPILVYWRVRNEAVPEAQRFYLTGAGLAARIEARRQSRIIKDALITFVDAQGNTHNLPLKDDPEYASHMLAEDILGPAIDARAGRIEVAMGSNGVVIAQNVDGIRYNRDPITPEQALQVMDYLKEHAGLDLEDRRRHQTGDFQINRPDGKYDISVTTAGSSNSQVLRIDIDRAKRLKKPFDTLGLLPSQQEALATLEEPHNRHGIVLVGAPPAQGLSTSMYSFLGRHDAYTSNIKALERELLLEMDGIDHVQWDASNPEVDYASHLQSILRRDPDIVMTSFIKDAETATIITDPGTDGPLLYVPIRKANIVEMVNFWVKMIGNLKQATRALKAVTNQRLMRTLCPNCKHGYEPTAEQLRKLNLPAEKVPQLFRTGGKIQIKNKIEPCPICQGIGYFGQTAVFEVMMIDDAGRKILAKGDLKAALAHARRNKMITMQEAALQKVINGDTTIEELIRVMSPTKNPSLAKSPA